MKKILTIALILTAVLVLPTAANGENFKQEIPSNSCCISEKNSQYHKKNYLVIPDYRSKNLSLFYIDGYKYKRPSAKPRTKAAKVLIKEIQKAKESIYFAIYGIAEQPVIEKALINAKRRGVKVKGVVDMTQDNKNIYSDTEKFIESLGNIHNDYEIADKRER